MLFDFGGVLSTSPFEAFAAYEREHGLAPGFIRSLNATDPDRNAWACLERNEIGFDEFCGRFAAEASAAGGEVDARALFARFRTDVRPEMVEAVRRCRAHYRVGVLSNTFVAATGDSPVAGVLALFDAVVESATVGVRKPDPRAYLLACDALGTAPEHTAFLDDLGINLKPARALGMRTIKVDDPGRALSELGALLGLDLGGGGPTAQETGA